MDSQSPYGPKFNLSLQTVQTFRCVALILPLLAIASGCSPAIEGKPTKEDARISGDTRAEVDPRFDEAHDAYLNGDLTSARNLLLPLAANSDAMAQFYLGVILGFEFYAESDPEQSRSWIMKAAEGGHTDAMIYICLNFLDDDPAIAKFVSRNREMMIEKMSQIAASQRFSGQGRSLEDFSYIALANLAGQSSETERLRYARIAHKRIHPWGGPTLLGDLLWDEARRSGRSLREHDEERLEIIVAYMLDAYKGYPPAQLSLGRFILENGSQNERAVSDGWAWIIWASRQGHKPATDLLKVRFDTVSKRIQQAALEKLDVLFSDAVLVRDNYFQWCRKRFQDGSEGIRACSLAAPWHHLACTLPREWHKPRTFWRTELYAMCRQHMMDGLGAQI